MHSSPKESLQPSDWRLLQEQVKKIRYGILRITGKHVYPFPNILIETLNLDEEGYLWCMSSDSIPPILLINDQFKVSVKYVQKKDGLFIKLSGNAFVAEVAEVMDEIIEKNQTLHAYRNRTMLKIQILEADLFRKKFLSRYTSILQSALKFSVRNLLPHS